MTRNLLVVLLLAIFIFGGVVNYVIEDLNEKIELKNKELNKTIQQLKNETAAKAKAVEQLKIEQELKTKALEDNRRLKETSRGASRKSAGVWKITFYTPSVKECGNSKGITASGKKVIPNYTVAIDKRYWQFKTKFYVEGFGTVEAMDTGGAIKGSNRMDICILDVNKALSLGVQQRRVWVIGQNRRN